MRSTWSQFARFLGADFPGAAVDQFLISNSSASGVRTVRIPGSDLRAQRGGPHPPLMSATASQASKPSSNKGFGGYPRNGSMPILTSERD
jgi:hypothetical protein